MKYDPHQPCPELEAAAQANYETRMLSQLGPTWTDQTKAWSQLGRPTRHEYYAAAAVILNTQSAAGIVRMTAARAAKKAA